MTIRLQPALLVTRAFLGKWLLGCAVAATVLFGLACWVVPSGAYSR